MFSSTKQRCLAVLLAGTLSLQSCATLFTGTRDVVRFESKPAAARVRIDGLDVGRTPVDVSVQRTLGSKLVTMELDDFESRTFQLNKEFNAVSVLNLFGLVGWAVDAATGAMMKYSQKLYTIELAPAKK
ncbi:hypothetical protein GCM10027578_06900 [Spirosoma luteolum]